MKRFKNSRKSLNSVLGLLLLACSILLYGCRRATLPDPQVIRGPERVTKTPEPSLTLTPTQTPSPIPTAPAEEVTATPAGIRYDVPVLSQDGLLLNGAPTGVGCVPVCIEMMTAWWNAETGNPVLGAQEIIDRNAEQGLYAAGRGMSSASASDELAELGYVHSMTLNGSKEELLEALKTHGPVGVLVKTNWVPTTMNHAAVLTAYDPQTDEVTLNDPFYGSTVTWPWESFDGIWGLNYAGDPDYTGRVVRRVYFVIHPDEELHK